MEESRNQLERVMEKKLEWVGAADLVWCIRPICHHSELGGKS